MWQILRYPLQHKMLRRVRKKNMQQMIATLIASWYRLIEVPTPTVLKVKSLTNKK